MKTTQSFRPLFAVAVALFLAGAVYVWANFGVLGTILSSGTLQGVVLNASDSKPLQGATVSIGKQHTTRTDAQGAYTLKSVPVGVHAVRISASGFKTVAVADVRVVADSVQRVNAWLYPGVEEEENTLAEAVAKDDAPLNQQGIAHPSIQSMDGKMYNRAESLGGRAMKSKGMLESMKMSTVPLGYAPAPIEREDAGFNTEEYAHHNDNEFAAALQNPLSTFSIDVDNASYSNMRRFLTMQQLPPKDAVRSEECINYFRYDYPQPSAKGGEPFFVNTEISSCPWNAAHKLVHIGLQGREIPVAQLPPTNLVFLIDVSGSMDSPEKLPLLKEAFTMLTKQLRAQDRVAITVYAGNAGVVLPSTSGTDKERILSALDKLSAGGSTAGGEGIKLAYSLAKQHFIKGGNNRVILATDGDFNVGVSSEGDLVRLIEQERESGVFLTVLGFGMGNYKDSKMEKLADKGNGNYSYIDNRREAERVLVGQMSGTLFTIAKDVKIQVEFNPAAVQAYRLIGYENRMLAKEDFNNDKKDAGEIGAGHTVTALYEIVPVGVAWQNPSGNASVDPLKYQTPQTSKENKRLANSSGEMMTVKIRYKEPDGSESKLIERPVPNVDAPLQAASNNFKFSAAVAEFAMILRESPFKANSSYNQVLSLARESLGKDPDGYRAEFVRLVETAQMLQTGVVRNLRQ
jgi:Ca-activated chloride channel family protein